MSLNRKQFRFTALIKGLKLRQLNPLVAALDGSGNIDFRSKPARRLRNLRKLKTFLGNALRDAFRQDAIERLAQKKYVLPAEGAKTDEIKKYANYAGLGNEEFQHLASAGSGFMAIVYRRPVLAARWIVFHLLFLNRTGKLAGEFRQEMATYVAFCEGLRKLQEARQFIILGDLSTELICLHCAVSDMGHRTISWQCDLQDPVPFPVEPDAAVVDNPHGVSMAAKHLGDRTVFWLDQRALPTQIQEATPEKPAAVLLMAFVQKPEFEALIALKHLFPTGMRVRLHPRGTKPREEICSQLDFASQNESLEEFLCGSGLVVVGNSTSQLKALLAGLPVIQCAGLDVFPYDALGFVKQRLVFGQDRGARIDWRKINQFYTHPSWRERFHELIAQPDGRIRRPLSQLLSERRCNIGHSPSRDVSARRRQ